MNTDFRIHIGLTTHPKTIKLMRRCGDRSFFCLINLWTWVSQYKPDGNLSGMDDEDIEISADWRGEAGAFVLQLIDIGFIDGSSKNYVLHDWCDHNPWASAADDRSEQGRLNKLKGRFPEQVECLKKQGVKGVTKEEYNAYIDAWKTRYPQGTLKGPLSKPSTPTPTPSPSPSPSPTPTPTPIVDSNSIRGKNFSPPTQEEVRIYCLEKNNGVDPEKWWGFYQAKGWMIGKNKMKDWKAAVSTWAKSPKQPGGGRQEWKVKQNKTARQKYMEDVGNLLEAIDGIDIEGNSNSIGQIDQPLPRGRAQRSDDKQAGG